MAQLNDEQKKLAIHALDFALKRGFLELLQTTGLNGAQQCLDLAQAIAPVPPQPEQTENE